MFDQIRENWRNAEEQRLQENARKMREEADLERAISEKEKREKQALDRVINETIFTMSAEAWARMRSKKLVKYNAFCVDANATVAKYVPPYDECKRALYRRAKDLGAEVVVDVRPTIMGTDGSGISEHSSVYLIGTALVKRPVA